MKLFEHAMELKKISEQYYRNLSNKCVKHPGIKNILDRLADDEMKHFSLFQKMKKDVEFSWNNHNFIDEITKEIANLKKKENDFSCDIDQIELYKEALGLEKKHLDFYKEKLLINKSEFSDILKEIIKDEEQHIRTLEYIIELISRPNNWVEQAEFNHKEDY